MTAFLRLKAVRPKPRVRPEEDVLGAFLFVVLLIFILGNGLTASLFVLYFVIASG